MKNFKKVLAVMTAVASLCMSATAFAAEGSVSSSQDLAGTYDVATNVLNITNNNNVLADSETTILVLTGELTDDEAANVTEGKIMYINQQNTTTDGKNFTGMGLKLPAGSETLGVGSYPVKVGCYNATTGGFEIKIATLEVTDGASGKTVKIVFGDVNNGEYTGTADKDMSYVDASDALAIIKAANGGSKAKGGIADIGAVVTTKDGKKFVYGDVNNGEYTGTADKDMSYVDASDALAIIKAANGGSKAKGGIADIGAAIEVKIAETK